MGSEMPRFKHITGLGVIQYTPEEEAEADVQDAKSAEHNRLNQYKEDRSRAYPSLQECIHAILDDDLEALQAKRAAVKTKYPKP